MQPSRFLSPKPTIRHQKIIFCEILHKPIELADCYGVIGAKGQGPGVRRQSPKFEVRTRAILCPKTRSSSCWSGYIAPEKATIFRRRVSHVEMFCFDTRAMAITTFQ